MSNSVYDALFGGGGQAGTGDTTVAPVNGSQSGTNTVDSIIDRYANEYGVDPNLVRAVVDTESGGNSGATSYLGATGLMQVMPATGMEIAEELGEPFDLAKLYDPETSIKYGTYYLGKQLKKFGSEDQALAAYHAGPHSVEEAIQSGFRIPFSNTDGLSTTGDYVAGILRKRDSGKFGLNNAAIPATNTASVYDALFGNTEQGIDQPAESQAQEQSDGLDGIFQEEQDSPAPQTPSITGPLFDTGMETQSLGSDVTAAAADATGVNQPFFKNEMAPANVLQPEDSGPIQQSFDEIFSGDQLREDSGSREMPELNRLNAAVEGVRSSLPTQGSEVANAFAKEGFGGEVVAGQLAGTVGQIAAGAAPVNAALKATAVGKSPSLTNVLTRTITAAGQRGAKDAGDVIAGKKEIEDALFDTVIESGGGAAFSIIPEIVIPSRAAQPFAQAFADVMYQSGVDLARGRNDVFTKEWFVEQIPTIAASVGFGLVDANNKNFITDQKVMRDEIADAIGSGKKLFFGRAGSEGTTPSPAQDAVQPTTGANAVLRPDDPSLSATQQPKEGDVAALPPQSQPEPTLNEIFGPPEDPIEAFWLDDRAKPPQRKQGDNPDDFQTPTDEQSTRGGLNLSSTKSEPGSNEPAPIFKWLRKYFASMGDLPEKVFNRKIKRDGRVNAIMSDVRWTLREFERAKKQAYGKSNIGNKEAFQIDLALKGEQDINSLPEPMRPVVRNMRDQIDALSRRLIDEGVAEGDLAARIEENLGFYANRSFRVFNDPNWSKNVPQEVKNRAHAFLRKEFPDLSDDKVNGLIDELLYKDGAPISVMSRGSKLGSKNLSIFKRRKDIPPEIRALWGEYKDADVNYTQSVTRMAHLLENHKFLRDIKEEGMGDFFHEEAVRNSSGSYSAKISSEGSKVFEPLNGLYTTPEIKKAFEEVASEGGQPPWLRHYMKAVATTKWAKTVGSVQTHVRNTIGNIPFAVANGHFNIAKGGKAAKSVLADLTAKGSAETREYLKEMLRLGVIHDDASIGELRAILKDAQLTDIDKLIGKKWTKLAGKTVDTINNLYQAEDDIWKIYAFENEYARYSKALKGKKSDQEIKEIAAQNIRNTYPTYSMVPGAIKALRKLPVAGTFVSFPWEVMRTAVNTSALAAKELSDPDLRAIGAQRLAGMLTAATMTGGATAMSRYLAGVSEDDDEDLREFVPPWSKNSDLIHLGKKEDGTFMYVDLGYTDPYGYLKAPAMAVARGVKNEEDLLKVAVDAAAQLFEPFISEDIFTQRVTEFHANKKESGAPVYNPKAPLEDRLSDIVVHFAEVIEPGTITSLRRVHRGIQDRDSNRDPAKKYDPFIEAISMTTGFRGSKIDPMRSLKFKARELTKSIASVGQIDKGAKTDRERELVRKEYEEFDKSIGAAERLGYTKEQIRKALIDGGVSRERANNLSKRKFEHYIRQYK